MMRRWPAEWEDQRAVLLCFPRSDGDWGDMLDEASAAMIEAANRINEACPVTLVVPDPAHFEKYRKGYRGTTIELPADDCWIRDSGPITIDKAGRPLLLNFTFNGWGGKFDAGRDDRLPFRLREALYPDTKIESPPYVLEGGAIDGDGRGTVITTSKCLLSDGRNNFTNKQQAEAMLRETLGTERVIWLDHGELVGDDTDAHVDTIVRFLDEDTIAYVGLPPPGDEQRDDFTALQEQLKEVAGGYRLVELPWAGPLCSSGDGHVLPASYANFLISNGTLFLPQYGIDADGKAIEALEAYGGYKIVGVDCRAFVEQHGALHCLTMQIPACP